MCRVCKCVSEREAKAKRGLQNTQTGRLTLVQTCTNIHTYTLTHTLTFTHMQTHTQTQTHAHTGVCIASRNGTHRRDSLAPLLNA